MKVIVPFSCPDQVLEAAGVLCTVPSVLMVSPVVYFLPFCTKISRKFAEKESIDQVYDSISYWIS